MFKIKPLLLVILYAIYGLFIFILPIVKLWAYVYLILLPSCREPMVYAMFIDMSLHNEYVTLPRFWYNTILGSKYMWSTVIDDRGYDCLRR